MFCLDTYVNLRSVEFIDENKQLVSNIVNSAKIDCQRDQSGLSLLYKNYCSTSVEPSTHVDDFPKIKMTCNEENLLTETQ
jgi:hypothetical protein